MWLTVDDSTVYCISWVYESFWIYDWVYVWVYDDIRYMILKSESYIAYHIYIYRIYMKKRGMCQVYVESYGQPWFAPKMLGSRASLSICPPRLKDCLHSSMSYISDQSVDQKQCTGYCDGTTTKSPACYGEWSHPKSNGASKRRLKYLVLAIVMNTKDTAGHASEFTRKL
jgi:hypothetical protein